MAGLIKAPRRKLFNGAYNTGLLSRGGSVGAGGGGPDTPATGLPTVRGNADGTVSMDPAIAAIHEGANTPVAQQQYAGPDAAAAQGLLGPRATNQDVQDLRLARFGGRMEKKRVDQYKQDQAAKDLQAKQEQAAGTMSVASAGRLGLFGAKGRYSKDYVIFDAAGNPMQVDAATYVASLNRQKQRETEADKNRSSAETISENRVGLTKGRYNTQTIKTGKNREDVMIYDTVTGQEVLPPGSVDTSGWSAEDRASYNQNLDLIDGYSTELRKGNDGMGFLGLFGSRRNKIADMEKANAALEKKYASGPAAPSNVTPAADILSVIPDATPQEIGEIQQLLQQGMTLEEIKASL